MNTTARRVPEQDKPVETTPLIDPALMNQLGTSLILANLAAVAVRPTTSVYDSEQRASPLFWRGYKI